MVSRSNRPDQATINAQQTAAADRAEQERRDSIVYREVDLAEAERRRLFADLSATKATTVDAKMPLTKDSRTRKFVTGTLQKVLDREIEMQSIMHKVSPDDLQEIMKEGDAKNW